ncbi:zinc finger protein 862-like [Rhizophagus clarus]|uniref:Zinc finger protein 862-like n=1 Tax=Rhizophagus clarus TaxID=94130 RepID=A0A8H3LB87_9GLOM|nr:zinc finger protein 862-like [Rhizophagus clarus]
MTLLRYYKPINANVNNRNKNTPNEKDKSLSENDKNDLFSSEISSSETPTEEETLNEIEKVNSQRSFRKISKSHIIKRKIKAKINKKGLQRKWLKEFSWLRYDSKEKKMHCELCRFHGINIPFAKEGSKNIGKKSAIQEHNSSSGHKEALKKESSRLAMVKATSNAINYANKHVESLMKIIYSMAQNNLPLNQFSQLVQLAKDLLSAISLSIEEELWSELNETTCFGIMVDESTDISTESHIILYVKYCLRGFIKVKYVKLLHLNGKDAESIFSAIFSLLESKGLEKKIMSFSSDGASVMLGRNNGVATKLANKNPYLFVSHCIAHRLALACNSAQKQVAFCKYIETLIKETYHFFSNSEKRVETLRNFQSILDHPTLKIKNIFEIRWLSWYEAVKSICVSIGPLLDTILEITTTLSFQRQQSVFDLYSKLCNWKVLAFLHFLYDILGHLMELSKMFQRRYIIFSDIDPIINSTIQKIQYEYLEVDDDGNQKLSAHLNNFLSKAPPAKETFIGNHHILFESQDEVDLQVDIMEFAAAVICEINDRFPHRSILSSMKIMNPIEWPKNNESLNDYGEKELEELIDFYGVANEPNYPIPIIDADAIRDEWDNFKAIILANYRNLSIDDLLPLLFQYHSDMYPNILVLISIFYSIPFSSVDCERGFSRQNLIKTDICNQLNNDTLHILMMVGLHNVNLIEFNFDNALRIWYQSCKRRIK